MTLIPTPQSHPAGAPSQPWPERLPDPFTWSGWHSVAKALDDGELLVPPKPGAYLFRIAPSVGLVPASSPSRLLHIGGMGPTGTLFQRVGNFVGAGLGRGGVGPQSSAGLKFGWLRAEQNWAINIRDVELAFCVVPPEQAHCVDVACWYWYWNEFVPSFQPLAEMRPYPGCDSALRTKCACGWNQRHRDFEAPPAP